MKEMRTQELYSEMKLSFIDIKLFECTRTRDIVL